jgi:hypothetical protein
LVGTRPRLPRAQGSAVNAIGKIRERRDFGKKDIGLPHASHAAGRRSGQPFEKGTNPSSLAKAVAAN